jgi:hypothetical protein
MKSGDIENAMCPTELHVKIDMHVPNLQER